MARVHCLKLDIEFCAAVYNGKKSFEIRQNDRGYQTGDIIRFKAVKNGQPVVHPINFATFDIAYVLNGWGLKNGFVALAIRKRGNGCDQSREADKD